jgi:hypothetical protein
LVVDCGALAAATEPSSLSPSFSTSFPELVAEDAGVEDGFTGAGTGAFGETELMDMAAFQGSGDEASSARTAQQATLKRETYCSNYRQVREKLEGSSGNRVHA